MTNVYNDLLIKINEKQIYLNEPMKKHTTFKIGGPADIFVKVKTIQELKYVIDVAKKENAPVTVIGNGSNILVKDGGIRGIVVKPEFKEIEFIDEETKRIVDTGYNRAKQILSDHVEKLHAVAKILLEKEKIEANEFEAIFGE